MTLRDSYRADGDRRQSVGDGPVDAVFKCIKSLIPHEATLELFQVHAVTEGTDAQAEVSVRLSHNGHSMTRRAVPTRTPWWRPQKPISARSTSS